MAHQRSLRITGIPAPNDLADCSAVHWLSKGKGLDIALAGTHSPAHVGIYRHPKVSHEHFSRPRFIDRRLNDLEIVEVWHAYGITFQVDFA